jgi:UDP-2,3-diacylglucosamine hydrolase
MSTLELTAKPGWQSVDFISDLHLQASEPATFNAWQRYMQTTPADAVFILGDLFEVWVGDDVLGERGFEHQCAQVIAQTAASTPVYFMHGNRDFLVGATLTAACNTTLLADPTVLSFNNKRWLLSHGDALCLDDADYMQFRQQVRSTEWQKAFLAKPLAERQAIARGLRQQSEARKRSGIDYADVDSNAARQWLEQALSATLIHGHTHKPATHDLGDGLQRVVLSDWDMAATAPRAEVLRLSAQGLQRINLT